MLFELLTTPFASNYLQQILNQFSKAVLVAVNGGWNQRRCIRHAFLDLANLETRPPRLAEIAYGWCSAIYENRKNLGDWEDLLPVCLELGFRRLDQQNLDTSIELIHTEHHRGLVDVVFKSQKSEAIADLLNVWTPRPYRSSELADTLFDIITGHLFGLHTLIPSSPRLRQHVVHFIEGNGRSILSRARAEELIEFLNQLHVTFEEMSDTTAWSSLLLDMIRSPVEIQCLSDQYWELLVEFAVLASWNWGSRDADGLIIARSLIEAEEWDKLECWIGILWMALKLEEIPQGGMSFVPEGITEEDLEHPTLLLFHHRPGAAQRLEQLIERWSRESWNDIRRERDIPEWVQSRIGLTSKALQRILARAHEAVQRQDAL